MTAAPIEGETVVATAAEIVEVAVAGQGAEAEADDAGMAVEDAVDAEAADTAAMEEGVATSHGFALIKGCDESRGLLFIHRRKRTEHRAI